VERRVEGKRGEKWRGEDMRRDREKAVATFLAAPTMQN